MSNFKNAAPYANLQGIQDRSTRPPVREPEANPTHLPHVYLYTEKGPTIPQVASGDALASLFGPKSLDPRWAGYNHQSVLAGVLQRRANAMLVQRLIPADAGPKSRLLLSIDIVDEPAVKQYERNTDGSFKLDVTGAKIQKTGAGATAPGHIVKWVINDWNNGTSDDEFGAVASKSGSLVNSVSDQSTLYPILELEANFFGKYGNGLGLRLSAPTTASVAPLNDTIAESVKSYLFRMQLVSRADETVSPQIVETLSNEQSLNFSFKEEAVYQKLDIEYALEQIFMGAYQDLDTPGLPAQFGPFGQMKIYRNNLEDVLEMIGALEAPQGTLPVATMDATSEYLYSVNPFTAVNYDGVPYHTVDLRGPLQGGVSFTEGSTYYAAGGSDGTMNDTAFDALVRSEALAYGSGEADLLDSARYTQSIIYDTGFTMDTKLALLTPLGKRKDIAIVLSTQDVLEPQNTPAEESSIALSLLTAARNYPESEIYGTSVCRAVVIGQSGYLLASKYKKLLPLTIELADKLALYMGASNGVWKNGFGPDSYPNNTINMFRDVNATFKSANARTKDWDTGLVWAQSFDRRSLFFPALQTVYEDDSSILNSVVNMLGAVELQKVCERTWRKLTGISNLSEGQFIARSDKMIADDVDGRFDGRFTIVPETFFTAGDSQRGYSWSCKINQFGEGMKTVGTFTVTAARRSDLGQGA